MLASAGRLLISLSTSRGESELLAEFRVAVPCAHPDTQERNCLLLCSGYVLGPVKRTQDGPAQGADHEKPDRPDTQSLH